MSKILRRAKLTDELRSRVGEQVIDWVKHNPNRQVPSGQIAKMFGIADGQVTTVVKWLLNTKQLNRVSHFIYEMPAPVDPVQSETIPEKPQQQMSMVQPTSADHWVSFGDFMKANAHLNGEQIKAVTLFVQYIQSK